MTRALATMFAFIFTLAINTPLLAQQPPQAPTIRSNATVERLMRSAGGEGTVQLKGYVVQSSPEVVRLYWDLTLTRYFEVPRSAVLEQVQGSNPDSDPTTLYVKSSARIVSATSLPVDAAMMQRAVIDGLGNIPIEGPGIGPGTGIRPRGAFCLAAGALCLYGHLTGCGAAIACLAQHPL